MLLERTISQLDIGYVPPEQATQMGHLGYAQWLGALKGDAGYADEARRAHRLARPFMENSPAVGVFCDLLEQSMAMPPRPLPLTLPFNTRRGGAKARRTAF